FAGHAGAYRRYRPELQHGHWPQANGRLRRTGCRVRRQVQRGERARLLPHLAELHAGRGRRPMTAPDAAPPGQLNSQLDPYAAARAFLFHEAELLDGRRFPEWLNLMAQDIVYQVPVRVTRERSSLSEF